jgi:hypothetical protein
LALSISARKETSFGGNPIKIWRHFTIDELETISGIDRHDVLDWTVARMPKAYPAYFVSYAQFQEVQEFLDGFKNLFLIGRNGMHKYNNADHSMLTAMTAVDNILSGRTDKSNIWAVNTEDEYHERQTSYKVLSPMIRGEGRASYRLCPCTFCDNRHISPL